MCKLLNISRSSLYYAKNKPAKKYNAEEEKLTQHIKVRQAKPKNRI